MSTSDEKELPKWFTWLLKNGFAGFLGVVVVLVIPLVVFGLSFDARLDKIEDQLKFSPPPSYQPPNLEDFAVDGVKLEAVPVTQWIYVPSYSHIYHNGGSPYPLETTLSIRNVDIDQPLYLRKVKYFDTEGKLVETFVNQLIKLRPLQTIEFLVERRDSTGGSGANFVVECLSEKGVDKPFVRTVMVGTAGTQGISFSESGIEISPPSNEEK